MMYYVYYCIFKTLSFIPLRLLYLLSDFLYFVIYKCAGYRRKIVLENLRSSFPDFSEEQIRQTERVFYHQLCDNIVETVKLMSISARNLKRRINVVNPETVQKIGEEGKSIILMVGHLGNWEWMPAITLFFTKPENTMEIYKPQSDKAFDRLMCKIRERFGAKMIKQHSALRTILSTVKEKGPVIVGFLSDHRSNTNEAAKVEFLNHETPVTVGAEKIGRHIGAEFIYMNVEKPSRGRYNYRFEVIELRAQNSELRTESSELRAENSEFPYTEEYYRLLERNIRENPGIWLWSHRRWLKWE